MLVLAPYNVALTCNVNNVPTVAVWLPIALIVGARTLHIVAVPVAIANAAVVGLSVVTKTRQKLVILTSNRSIAKSKIVLFFSTIYVETENISL